MRLTGYALVILASAGCVPASTLPSGQVLSYGVSHRGGGSSLRVMSDGTAEASQQSWNADEKSGKAKLTQAELDALADKLNAHSCCSHHSMRSTGVPGEARPSYQVRIGGLDCNVKMWDNDIHDDADAKACYGIMYELVARVLK